MDRLESLDEAISRGALQPVDLITAFPPVNIDSIRADIEANPPLEGRYVCERIVKSSRFALYIFIISEALCCTGLILSDFEKIHYSINIVFSLVVVSLVPAAILTMMFIKLTTRYGPGLIDRFFRPIDVAAATARAYDAAVRAHAYREQARQTWLMSQTLEPWRKADGPTFERLTAREFRRQGWKVQRVGGANDGGVDLRLRNGEVLAVVQCKAYAKPVSPAVVRELYGAMLHEDAEFAILVCLSGASKAATAWADGKPIMIMMPETLLRGTAEVVAGRRPIPARRTRNNMQDWKPADRPP
jgi:hypothetical protein